MLLMLAIVALAFRIVAPPGTMVANTAHGAALVICTGHGAMPGMAEMGKAPAGKVPASTSHSDGSCEFAAHAANVLAGMSLAVIGATAWSPATVPRPVVLFTTGRGLAAPPPPSHAPPSLLQI